jgi:hypothetical protein
VHASCSFGERSRCSARIESLSASSSPAARQPMSGCSTLTRTTPPPGPSPPADRPAAAVESQPAVHGLRRPLRDRRDPAGARRPVRRRCHARRRPPVRAGCAVRLHCRRGRVPGRELRHALLVRLGPRPPAPRRTADGRLARRLHRRGTGLRGGARPAGAAAARGEAHGGRGQGGASVGRHAKDAAVYAARAGATATGTAVTAAAAPAAGAVAGPLVGGIAGAVAGTFVEKLLTPPTKTVADAPNAQPADDGDSLRPLAHLSPSRHSMRSPASWRTRWGFLGTYRRPAFAFSAARAAPRRPTTPPARSW